MGHTGFPLDQVPLVIPLLSFLLQVSFDKVKPQVFLTFWYNDFRRA
jgi:hypothetical protein